MERRKFERLLCMYTEYALHGQYIESKIWGYSQLRGLMGRIEIVDGLTSEEQDAYRDEIQALLDD